MSFAPVLLVSWLLLGPSQGPGPDSLAMLAMRSDTAALAEGVRQSPDAGRAAMALLLTRAAAPDDSAAAFGALKRLAGAIARQLGDSFPLRQTARFAAWSPPDRLRKLRVDSLRRAGNAALGRDGFPSASREWRESLRQARELGDTAGMAAALGNLGAGWYGVGELDSAAAAFGHAESLAKLVGDNRTALNALGGLANVRRDRGDLRGAEELYTRTSALRERIGDVRGVAADRNNLGILAQELGDLAGARHAFEAALALSERHGLGDAEATNLLNLARLSTLAADYDAALARYARARELFRSQEDRQGEALVLRSLGLIELRRGDYVAARSRLREALVLYCRVGPPGAVVDIYADLARAASAVGNLRQAAADLDRAAVWVRRSGGAAGPDATFSLARGGLALDLNRFAEAERWFGRAEDLFGRAGDAASRAETQQGRGYLLLLDGQNAKAASALEFAARGFELLGDRREAALTSLDMAVAYQGLGRSADAEATLASARDSLHVLDDPVGESAAIVALADLYRDAGRPAAADAAYREALEILGTHAAPAVAWRIHAGRGRALAEQGALAPAAEELEAAIREIERGAAVLPAEQGRTAYLADKWGVYSTLARIERERGQDSTAFEVSERLRAREMLDALGRGRIAWKAQTDSGLVRREQDLRLAITRLAAEVGGTGGEEVLRGPDPHRPGPPAAREALAQAESSYADLLTTLREREPEYAAMVAGHVAPWRAVAEALPADGALLEYLVADSSVTLFVVSQRAVHAVDLGTDRRAVAELVDFVRGLLAAAGSGDPAARAPLQRLYHLLIEPAKSAGFLTGIQRLVIAPHAELHYLPFSALLDRERNPRYLVERYDVSYVPSASVWLESSRRPTSDSGVRRVLALAPDTSGLPGSRMEVAAIRRLFRTGATLLEGSAASKRALRAALPSYDVLHFATYGVLNRRNPLFSYVELAPDGPEDGRLEVHEISALPVTARLVVLSACQTSVGSGTLADVPSGDDWQSLTRAFLSAGAGRVAGTLWPVEDRSTAKLMTWFYAGLAAGRGEAAALAEAQRRAIATPALSNPYYWAGFELVGGP